MIAILRDRKGFQRTFDMPYRLPYIKVAVAPDSTLHRYDDPQIAASVSIVTTVEFYFYKNLEEGVDLYLEK